MSLASLRSINNVEHAWSESEKSLFRYSTIFPCTVIWNNTCFVNPTILLTGKSILMLDVSSCVPCCLGMMHPRGSYQPQPPHTTFLSLFLVLHSTCYYLFPHLSTWKYLWNVQHLTVTLVIPNIIFVLVFHMWLRVRRLWIGLFCVQFMILVIFSYSICFQMHFLGSGYFKDPFDSRIRYWQTSITNAKHYLFLWSMWWPNESGQGVGSRVHQGQYQVLPLSLAHLAWVLHMYLHTREVVRLE